jgi:hypothetical protein
VPSSCDASSWVVVADPDRILDAILAGKRERVSYGGQCTLRRQPFRAASRKQPQEPGPFGIRGFNTERTVVHVSESASVAAGMQERRLALWILYGQRAFASPAGGQCGRVLAMTTPGPFPRDPWTVRIDTTRTTEG